MKRKMTPITISASAAPIMLASFPLRLELNHDDALFGQLAHGVRRSFSRVARVLDPAVGHLVGSEGGGFVDGDPAELERLGRCERGVDVRREDSGLQPVLRAVGELEGLIVPTRGQVIATEPIEEMLFEIPHYGRHGFDYWHQRLDGRIVAGGFRDVSLDTEFTADEVTTPVVQAALERFVEEHVGRPLRVDYRWAGIFGMVFDFLPVVGRVPGQDGLWVAGGYSGHGNVLGFACGRLVAQAILGEDDPKLELFEPARLLVS